MILARHFHDEIVGQALTSALLLVVGVVAATVLWIGVRGRAGAVLVVVTLAGLGVGGYRAAEAGALRHNHRCHAHNFDGCGDDHDREAKGHTHAFGGWAAELEAEPERAGRC